jgi:hypothetical protein
VRAAAHLDCVEQVLEGGVRRRVGVLEEEVVQHQHGPLAHRHPARRERRADVRQQVAGQGRGQDARKGVEGLPSLILSKEDGTHHTESAQAPNTSLQALRRNIDVPVEQTR